MRNYAVTFALIAVYIAILFYSSTNAAATNTDPVLVQFKTQAANGNLGKFENINNFLLLNDTANAMQNNNSIVPVDIPEAAAKTINAIYLNTENCFGEQIKICNNDLITLRDIAVQCPYQYGSAVFQARMLLSFVDTTEYYNECENYYINNNNQKTINENTEKPTDDNGFVVYPNPATDGINVLNNSETSAVIEIYNYIGDKVISTEIKNYSNFISIKELRAGMYLYTISINNEVVKTDKIIIIK